VLRRIQADRLASPELTGEMEFRLREVEHGTRSVPDFMKEIVEYTTHVVDRARSFDYDDLYPDEESLGTCPCEQRRPVYERAWFYRCQEDPSVDPGDDCPFRVWKDKAGRYVDRGTVRLLLEKGETPVLDGFLTRDGRTYRGVLKLEGRELKLVPVSDASGERAVAEAEYEVNDEPIGQCPIDQLGSVIETPTHYVCNHSQPASEEDKGCPFVLPRTVCKREITREEAQIYVRNGRTELLSDFISRNQRPFSATLFLKPSGRHGFEFPPRTGKAGGRGRSTRGRKTTGKKTTRKKTSRKKGTAKTGAAESSATRKQPVGSRRKPTASRPRRKPSAAKAKTPPDE
jgi:DNA topoisomerase-3